MSHLAFKACMAFGAHEMTPRQFWRFLVTHGYWDVTLRLGDWTYFVNLCSGT
jgi:hypothetical protein